MSAQQPARHRLTIPPAGHTRRPACRDRLRASQRQCGRSRIAAAVGRDGSVGPAMPVRLTSWVGRSLKRLWRSRLRAARRCICRGVLLGLYAPSCSIPSCSVSSFRVCVATFRTARLRPLARPISPSRMDFVVLSLSAPGQRSRGTPTAGGSIASVCPQDTVSSTSVRCSSPFQCRLRASPASRTPTRY